MPTIKDVAAEAGVTSTTVSRVLNNRGYISEETREKVYSAMEKLNYMPNEMARNLSRQKSDYIGVILPSVEHPYFSKVLHWLEHYVTKHNYKIMVCILICSIHTEFLELLCAAISERRWNIWILTVH